VQVGNEITSGMLWPLGKVSGNGGASWSRLGQLMNAAIQGIRDAAGARMPGIIVHIDRGGDWAGTKWFFDNLNAQSVPFDIIGESYYPFFHGSPASLSNCLNNAAARYGKPVIVAEDAFPWTNACPSGWLDSLCGFPPTVAGQVSFMAALAGIVEGVTNRLGAGFFYWGAEYRAANGVNEAGYDTSSFFDFNGNVLPVADAVGGMGAAPLMVPFFDGSNLRLQWPFSGAASRLVTASSLGPPAIWSLVTNSVQTTGAVFTVTLPVGNNVCYYRLQPNR
jgi:arabinogalactan endo-1,4-beta-galactosidase